PGRKKLYVGEGDSVISRLAAHNKDPDKDFWEEAIVFTSKDQNLTKAHVRYLEARLISLAGEAKRATVANSTTPNEQGRLPEPDEVEMEEFIPQPRFLLGTRGYDLFAPFTPPQRDELSATKGGSELILSYAGEGYSATCVVDQKSGQFIV